MTYNIIKIYEDRSEARSQTFETRQEAVDYLDMITLKAKTSGEFYDEAPNLLVIKREGKLLTYELREE